MGWSMDRQGIRTLFDHESKRLKQVKLSGPRRERVSLDIYVDAFATSEAEFRQETNTASGLNQDQMSCAEHSPGCRAKPRHALPCRVSRKPLFRCKCCWVPGLNTSPIKCTVGWPRGRKSPNLRIWLWCRQPTKSSQLVQACRTGSATSRAAMSPAASSGISPVASKTRRSLFITVTLNISKL